MFDLVRCHFASYRSLGFEKAFELANMSRNVLFEEKKAEAIRIAAKRHPLFYFPFYEPDLGMIKAVAEGKGAFVISVRDLLRNSGSNRAVMISKMRTFLMLCVKYRAKYVICSLAEEEFEARSARELVSIGELLGLSYEQATAAVSRLPEILGEKQ